MSFHEIGEGLPERFLSFDDQHSHHGFHRARHVPKEVSMGGRVRFISDYFLISTDYLLKEGLNFLWVKSEGGWRKFANLYENKQ
jgi:hypothetical protein